MVLTNEQDRETSKIKKKLKKKNKKRGINIKSKHEGYSRVNKHSQPT